MDGCVGAINTFVVEPFVPHKQEYYMCIQVGFFALHKATTAACKLPPRRSSRHDAILSTRMRTAHGNNRCMLRLHVASWDGYHLHCCSNHIACQSAKLLNENCGPSRLEAMHRHRG